MKMSPSAIWILVAVILFSIAICLYYFGYRPIDKEIRFCEAVSDSLSRRNLELQRDIERLNLDIAIYKSRVDSLEKQKRKVIIEYLDIYEKIDTASAPTIVSEFERIFPKSSNK